MTEGQNQGLTLVVLHIWISVSLLQWQVFGTPPFEFC